MFVFDRDFIFGKANLASRRFSQESDLQGFCCSLKVLLSVALSDQKFDFVTKR